MGNRDIEAARHYHQITAHSYTSVRTAPHFLDWDNRPLPYKIYPDAPTVALPRELALSQMPTMEAISTPVPAPDPDTAALDREKLSRILFCAGGLTRHRRVGEEDYHFRAAPSAGALYPIEVYCASAGVEGLAPGLYHFSPADLKLRGLRPGDLRAPLAAAAAGRPSLINAQAVFILSAIFWRSAWKYRARAYRYCGWDAGTMVANLLAVARAEGMAAEVVSAFDDGEVEALVGADGEGEGIMCLVALGRAAPTTDRGPGALAPIEFATVPLSRSEVRYPDLVKMHRESRLTSATEVSSIAREALTVSANQLSMPSQKLSESTGLGETILRRGSTRRFARESIGVAELKEIMARSSGPVPADFAPLCDIYLIINSVEGIESGAYFYDRVESSFDLIKGGNFRGEAGYLCLEQPLGEDCSVLVCYMADLSRLLTLLGNRGYRDAHLEAGILGGRAYLAAYALGHGATGLTFYDQDTSKFFQPHAASKEPILMVALGVPYSMGAEARPGS